MRGLRFGPAAGALLWLLACRMALAVEPVDPRAARQQFQLAMLQAERAGAPADDGAADATDDPALRAYALYPYLQAERIRQAFNNPAAAAAADRRAAGFLATYGLLPVGIALRRSWLENLAQRSQWDAYLTIYRDAGASDAQRCQSFTARIAINQTAQLGPLLVHQWLIPHETAECERAFAWGIEHGIITTDLIARRARLMLQAANPVVAKALIARLPPGDAQPLRQWATLLEQPQRGIDALIGDPASPVLPEGLLAAWARFARQDPDGAVDRYAQLVRARNLTSQSASPFAPGRRPAAGVAARCARRGFLRPRRNA